MRPRSLTFVIPTHARRETLRRILGTVEARAGAADIPIDIVVVDDASTDGTAEMLAEAFPNIVVLRNTKPRGFDALPDAVALARGELVFFLDDDAYPDERTVALVLDHFERRGERLGLVALPFVEPESGRTVYTPYLPAADGEPWRPTHAFLAGAAVFRREVLEAVPPSPPGYFLYCTEPAAALEVLAHGWEADHLPDAPVYHLFEARRARIRPNQAILPFRNDLVTIRRYYRGLQRIEMLAGRYLTGLIHLLAARSPGALWRVHREAGELVRALGRREVEPWVRERVYRCFDGTTLRTLVSETNRRRVAYALGRLPIDQVG